MKTFAELDFIKNLSWAKLLTSIVGIITVYTSVIWVLATRATDSRADYVNMRYSEITTLEDKLKTLESENLELKQQLGKSPNLENESSSDIAAHTVKSGYSATHKSGVMVSIKEVYHSSANGTLTFPNGTTENRSNLSVGSTFPFENKNKKYLVVFSEFKPNESITYIVREISQ